MKSLWIYSTEVNRLNAGEEVLYTFLGFREEVFS